MNPEERAALLRDLGDMVNDRQRLMSDVRATVAEEVAKALKELKAPTPGSAFITGEELSAGARTEIPSGQRVGGIEFVVSEPPRAAVLRALKQPLFDFLVVPEDGRIPEGLSLFSDSKWFPDHTRKLFGVHTNLLQDGQIGHPLEYDLSSLEIRVVKWSHPDDLVRALRGLVFQWYFGQNVAWLRAAGADFTPLLLLPHEVESEAAEVRRQIAAFGGTGVWPAWTHSMETKDGKARRISSVESFRLGVEVPKPIGELHGPVHFKVLMQDTLYAAL